MQDFFDLARLQCYIDPDERCNRNRGAHPGHRRAAGPDPRIQRVQLRGHLGGAAHPERLGPLPLPVEVRPGQAPGGAVVLGAAGAVLGAVGGSKVVVASYS